MELPLCAVREVLVQCKVQDPRSEQLCGTVCEHEELVDSSERWDDASAHINANMDANSWDHWVKENGKDPSATGDDSTIQVTLCDDTTVFVHGQQQK